MVASRAVALTVIALPFALAACAGILGIDDLGVDAQTVTAVPDAEPEADVQAVIVDAAMPMEAGDGSPEAGAKRVFLTSDVSNGIMNGTAGADARCTVAATRGALGGGPWVAWMSGNGANAIDRITYDGPYYLIDGRRVVSSKSQLRSGNLDVAIDVTENRLIASGAPWVWTGTLATGLASETCNDWTTNNFATFGALGSFDQPKNGDWTDNGGPGGGFRNWGCQTSGRLYCFER